MIYDMTKGLISVAIGLVVFIMVTELVDALVTGTDTGSVIIQNILALAVSLNMIVAAHRSNPMWKTRRIRWTLSHAVKCYA